MGIADPERLEGKIDKIAAGATEIKMDLGGVQFRSMVELMEFSKLMAVSGLAVPVHLRNNAGACLAVCTKALRFGFDPFSLAEHSYAMGKNIKVGDKWGWIETIAYDSFVIRAIIQAHASITGELDYAYAGEGDARKCTVSAQPSHGGKVKSHTSPTLGELKAARGRNDKGQIKGSPLWDAKPDVQLGYDTGRDYCRLYHPEILLGWYDKDEMEEYGGATITGTATPAADPKPAVAERLKGNKGRGFSEEGVTQALAHQPAQTIEAAVKKEPVPVAAKEPEPVQEKAQTANAGSAPENAEPEPEFEAPDEALLAAQELDRVKQAGRDAASWGTEDLKKWWVGLDQALRDQLGDFKDKELKPLAAKNDGKPPAAKLAAATAQSRF